VAPVRTTVPTAPVIPTPLPPPTPVPPPAPPPAAAPAAQPLQPASSAPDAGPSQLRSLYQQAAERYATLPGYTAQLRRREQINGKDRPEETILFKFRQEPWSVYFKWLGPQGQGREVIFVKGQHNNTIHTLLAQGDMPLMPAGRQMELPPDNYFVRSSSRHSITEAGIGMMIDHFGQLVANQEKSGLRRATLRYRGAVTRPEFPQPLDAVEETVPAGSETAMPKGGKRQWFFDSASHLPLLVITHDYTDHEVEYYCYENLRGPIAFSDDDFNPEKLWKKN
jgi:hypothetical protein